MGLNPYEQSLFNGLVDSYKNNDTDPILLAADDFRASIIANILLDCRPEEQYTDFNDGDLYIDTMGDLAAQLASEYCLDVEEMNAVIGIAKDRMES